MAAIQKMLCSDDSGHRFCDETLSFQFFLRPSETFHYHEQIQKHFGSGRGRLHGWKQQAFVHVHCSEMRRFAFHPYFPILFLRDAQTGDIGHGAKGLELHKKWSRRIIEEFFQQGDMEHRSGFPVSPLCDRTGNISKVRIIGYFLKILIKNLFWMHFFKKKESGRIFEMHSFAFVWEFPGIHEKVSGRKKSSNVFQDRRSKLPAWIKFIRICNIGTSKRKKRK